MPPPDCFDKRRQRHPSATVPLEPAGWRMNDPYQRFVLLLAMSPGQANFLCVVQGNASEQAQYRHENLVLLTERPRRLIMVDTQYA